MADGAPGAGVDAQGRAVIDPTENVKADLRAAVKRLDDLRESEVRHLTQNAAVHAGYQKELREAESDRIDAIRAVDVGNVQRAAEVAATQAETLRQQVATSAETLRTQVAAAATAATSALAAALQPIQKDISDLRQSQWQGAGEKSRGTETRAGVGLWIAIAVAVSGFLIGIGGLVVAATN